MKSIINELWHGNIIPQEDSRTNSKEMKELLGYMARHHEDLEKGFSDEQKETFEKFHDCWSEYMSSSFISLELVRLSSCGMMFPCQSSLMIDFIDRSPPAKRFLLHLP